MSTKKLFSEWYGYDKVVKSPQDKFSNQDLGYRITGYNGTAWFLLSSEAAEVIMALPADRRHSAANAYYTECDGITADDFKTWLHSQEYLLSKPNDQSRNWRNASVRLRNPGLANEYHFHVIIGSFFGHKSRSDRIFRMIEINEFVHRGAEGQTLENFLETDTSYQGKCKDLVLEVYSPESKRLFGYGVPKIFMFGGSTSLKVKKLLLELTVEEMKKVLDWKNNSYYSSSSSDASVDFAALFIGAALGNVQKIEVKEMKGPEIKNAVMAEFFSGSKEFWSNLGARTDTSRMVAITLEELEAINFDAEEFTRNFSYFIRADVLGKLTPVEIIALVLGYHKSARWAQPNKGDTTQEVITQMMMHGKLDPEFIAKLIAHIVISNNGLIIVNDELIENSFDEMPISWAYQMLPKSNQKRKLVHPAAVSVLI